MEIILTHEPNAAQPAQPTENPQPAKRASPAIAALKWFRKTYPVIDRHLPLAIGVGDGLRDAAIAAGHAPEAAAKALRLHFNSHQYLLAAMAVDAMRHDLAGVPVSPVTQDHRDHAAKLRGDSVAKAIRRYEAQKLERAAAKKKAAASGDAKTPKPNAPGAGAGTPTRGGSTTTAQPTAGEARSSATPTESPKTAWGRPLPAEPSTKPLGLSLRNGSRSTMARPPVVVRLKSRKPVQRR
jgi:sRNA-binding protein